MYLKSSTSILAFLACSALSAAFADEVRVRQDAPDRYVVKKGDTLWGIAGKYLRDPWRWPDLWRMNKGDIKNPHWIYPGNVIVMEADEKGGTPQMSLVPTRDAVKLSPTVRVSELEPSAIPSIPPTEIEPFLNRPLIVDAKGLSGAATIVDSEEEHMVMSNGMTAYATGVDATKGTAWQIYRPGKALVSPGHKEVLGYEAQYLGNAHVQRFGQVSTIEITGAREEIVVGDRLIPAVADPLINYSPHAPESDVQGQVISLPSGVAEVGTGSIVAVDVGTAQGVETGHVLAVLRPGPRLRQDSSDPLASLPSIEPERRPKPGTLTLPNERVGLLFLFRIFDKVSYGLVLNSSRQVQIGDIVSKP